MVAGRYHWKGVDAKPARKTDLLAFHFAHGTLLMAEAGARKRASLHIVHGEAALAAFDLCGLEPMDCTEDSFRVRFTNESHTLKRALTDPRMMSGIGNVYSDEILHAARLSSFRLASKLNYEEWARLFRSMRSVLAAWIDRLAYRGAFPGRVTAYRKGMAVHSQCGEPCPDCQTKVQRIAYADGRSNTEPLREWLQEGWSICSMESRAYGPSGLAVGITVEREAEGGDGADAVPQKRWRAKRDGGASGRGLPH